MAEKSLDVLRERFTELLDFIEENNLQEEFIAWLETRRSKKKQKIEDKK